MLISKYNVYEIEMSKKKTTIIVKIIDMLREKILVTKEI